MFKEVSANCFHKFLLIIFVFIFLCKSVAAQYKDNAGQQLFQFLNTMNPGRFKPPTRRFQDNAGQKLFQGRYTVAPERFKPPNLRFQGYSTPIQSGAMILGPLISAIGCVACVIKVCFCCCKSENRVHDSSPSTRNQRRIRDAERGSQASEEEQEDNRYPEMSVICLELKDAERGQNYKVCNHAESGLENESEHLDSVEIKEQEVCEVPLRVLYENPDKGDETNKFDPSSNAKEATDSGTYLEIVVEDGDDGVDKGLGPLYAEQEDFRKNLKPIDAPKESKLDYENPGIYEQESKTVYEKLDQFGNNLNPVDDQLNLSSMIDNPVDIKK